MSKTRCIKFLLLSCALALCAQHATALPDYLKLYDADPFAKPEMKGKCAVCHINPAGGGPRNDFGRAFAQAGRRITPELRQQFPDHFTSGLQAAPPVTFTSDHSAVVEINGKRYAIDTRDKSVKEVTEAAPATVAETKPAKPEPAPAAAEDHPNVYRPVDVRAVNLPTAKSISKGELFTDFTHRFPLGDPLDKAGLFGLDSLALPSFGQAPIVVAHSSEIAGPNDFLTRQLPNNQALVVRQPDGRAPGRRHRGGGALTQRRPVGNHPHMCADEPGRG